MATIPEKMSEKDVRELAEKIASSYMNGKSCDTREFIETFLNVRDAAIAMINVREEQRIASYHNNMSNLSFDNISEELPKSNLR